jgi:acyl carrier protein
MVPSGFSGNRLAAHTGIESLTGIGTLQYGETRSMQDYQRLLEELFGILEPFNTERLELREDTDLVVDLGLDSLKVVELLVRVEDSFDISIPLNILPQVRTIRDFAEQLERLLSEGV